MRSDPKRSPAAVKRYREILQEIKYDDTKQPKKDSVILTIDDKPVGTQDSLVCITGLPKGGKSTFLKIMVSSIIGQMDLFSIKMNAPAGRPDIVWFDTEHSDSEFYEIIQQVKKLMARDKWPGNFHAYKCSQLQPEQMIALIEIVLEDNPGIFAVFLDTVLDLSNNFNDVGEATKVGRWLKWVKKEYAVLIVAVLHLGKKELTSLGHLGSMIDRWGRSIMTVEKTKSGNYTLACKFQRGCQEFEPVTVTYTQDGELTRIYSNEDAQGARPEFNPYKFADTEHRYMIEKVLEGGQGRYKKMCIDLAELKGMSQVKAREFIRRWISEDWIHKKGDDYLVSTHHKLYKMPKLKAT